MCSDPEKDWYPHRQVCRADMDRAAAEWWYGELHEAEPFHDGTFKRWSDKRTIEFRYHFNDGVSIIVRDRDHDPDDDFLKVPDSSSPI